MPCLRLYLGVMRLPGRLGSMLLATLLVACAQVDPVLMPVSMPDCVYPGPSSMHEGTVRLSLTLNGITDAGVALVELSANHTPADLADHFEIDAAWEHRPSWISVRAELRLDSAQGADGVDETVALREGSYAVVCIDYTHDVAARVAGPLRVSS